MAREFINMPIPVDRVQEVYDLLGRPTAPASVAQSASAATEPEILVDGALLARAFRESPDSMKKVFRHLAKNPDRAVPMVELAQAVGYKPAEMAGALGAFGRRWKNRYHGGEDAKWPFDSWWDHENNTMVYKMSAAAAEVINGI